MDIPPQMQRRAAGYNTAINIMQRRRTPDMQCFPTCIQSAWMACPTRAGVGEARAAEEKAASRESLRLHLEA